MRKPEEGKQIITDEGNVSNEDRRAIGMIKSMLEEEHRLVAEIEYNRCCSQIVYEQMTKQGIKIPKSYLTHTNPKAEALSHMEKIKSDIMARSGQWLNEAISAIGNKQRAKNTYEAYKDLVQRLKEKDRSGT